MKVMEQSIFIVSVHMSAEILVLVTRLQTTSRCRICCYYPFFSVAISASIFSSSSVDVCVCARVFVIITIIVEAQGIIAATHFSCLGACAICVFCVRDWRGHYSL